MAAALSTALLLWVQEVTAMVTKTVVLAALVLLLAALAVPLRAADGPVPGQAPPPAGLLAPGAAPVVAARVSFQEGPAMDAGGDLYFSDLIGIRILKLLFDSCASVFDVTPLVMGRGSYRSRYPGATPLPFHP